MFKIISWMVITLSLVLLVASTSRPVMLQLWNAKFHTANQSWWGEHSAKGGDLVNIAYLDHIKRFQEPKDYVFTRRDTGQDKRINLVLYGDSFTEDVPGYAFTNLTDFHYGREYWGGLEMLLFLKMANTCF